MPVEISRSDLFVVAMLGCLTALVAWFAITRTLRRMWDAYLARGAAERGSDYMGHSTEGQRIMQANSDLSLAALDVPDESTYVIVRCCTPSWMRELVRAARQYKRAIPERNQRLMRADRRARQEASEYLGDE